jgi:hypothetical protein
MAGYDEPGENPFFVSYQETTSPSRTHFDSPKRAIPLEAIDSILRDLSPGLTPYQRDWAWKVLEQKGVLEKIADPNLDKLVAEAVKEVFNKTAAAIAAFSKRRA